MKTIPTLLAAAVLGLGVGLPVAAQVEGQGEIAVILIKIMTPDGPRWYQLGTDLSTIDVSEGSVIRFNYEGDTIEAITVVPDGQAEEKPAN